MPVNHEADSLDQVQRVVEALADHARFVIIRNRVHAESFTLYDQSQVRVRLLKKLEDKEITMPRMEEWLVEGLNRIISPSRQPQSMKVFICSTVNV